MILTGELIPCYDYRILCEYRTVLERPKFNFSKGEINALLEWIESNGRSIIAEPINIDFTNTKSVRETYQNLLKN